MKFLDSNILIYAADVSQPDKCSEFWSEDLNDGQIYCGIKAVNPFKATTTT